MSNSILRISLLMGAIVVAALPAFAQQPASSAPPAANSSAAAATSSTAPAAASAATATAATAEPAHAASAPAAQTPSSDSTPAPPSDETLKKAKSLGMRPEVRKGVTNYCWEDASIGSRFPTKKCVDASQLDEVIAQREADKDNMRRVMTGSGNK
jgi:cytoskeletal protein RodZ